MLLMSLSNYDRGAPTMYIKTAKKNWHFLRSTAHVKGYAACNGNAPQWLTLNIALIMAAPCMLMHLTPCQTDVCCNA